MRLGVWGRRLLAVPLLLALTGCANELTDALIEVPLGKLSELAVNMQFRTERDPLVFGYTYLLGEEHHHLVRRKNVPYRFHVVEVEEPNAFAIPYGGIYVTKGLLRFADTEDEVSFVMGHEVGHVERRHASLAFQRNLLITLGLQLVTNRHNEDWMQFAYLGNEFLDLHFSRENELAADREGAMYALNSGHDPKAGEDFFRKLDQRFGATPRFWSYFQTHPINRDRISKLKAQPQLAQDPVPLTLIGDGYLKRSLYPSAEASYQQALAVDPGHGPADLGLARVAVWRGQYAVARQKYNDAVAHGVPADTIQGELATLPDGPAPAQPEPAPATAADVTVVAQALQQDSVDLARLQDTGKSVWNQPLFSAPSLVASHARAGEVLDSLYGQRDHLSKPLQELVVSAQKIRAQAMAGASELGGAQEQARLTGELLARNRERMLKKLQAGAPTAATVVVGRAVLLDNEHAANELRDGVQRLNEALPGVRRAAEESYQSILRLHDSLTGPGRQMLVASQLDALMSNSQQRMNDALDRARRSESAIYSGRVRALQSSIDITLVDRPAYERAAAQKILARFLLAEPSAVDEVLRDGLSYGEAAYVLGMAKSADAQPTEMVALVKDMAPRQTVDRLGARGAGKNDNVAIILKLIDHTLLNEFEPAAAAQAETDKVTRPPGTPPAQPLPGDQA